MDGFRQAELDELEARFVSELQKSLEKVRVGHPEFLPLAAMGFEENANFGGESAGESAGETTGLRERVFGLAKTLEGLRSEVVLKAETLKAGDRQLQNLTTQIFEKQAAELKKEIERARADAAVKASAIEELKSEFTLESQRLLATEMQLRAELTQARQLCVQFEAELVELEREKSLNEKENENYKAHLTRLQDKTWSQDLDSKRIEETEAAHALELARAKAVTTERESEVASLHSRIESLEIRLSETREASAHLTAAFELEREERTKARKVYQDLVFDKKTQALEAKAIEADLQRTIAQLKKRPVEKVYLRVSDQEFTKMETSVKDMTATLREREAHLAIVETQVRERANEISRLRDSEASLQKELAHVTSTFSASKAQAEDIKASLKSQLAAQAGEIERQTTALNDLQGQLETERASFVKIENSLKFEIETLRSEIEDQEALALAMSTAKDSLERAFANERASLQERQVELEKINEQTKNEVRQLQALNEEATTQLELFEQKLFAITEKSETLRTEKETATRRSEVLDAKLASMTERFEADRTDFKERLRANEAEVLKLNERASDKDREVLEARAEIETKKSEIAILKTDLREAKTSAGRSAIGDAQAMTALREQLAAKQADLKELQISQTNLLTERDNLKSAFVKLESEFNKANESSLRDLARAHDEQVVLRAQRDAVRLELSQASERAVQAKAETAVAHAEVSAAKAETAKALTTSAIERERQALRLEAELQKQSTTARRLKDVEAEKRLLLARIDELSKTQVELEESQSVLKARNTDQIDKQAARLEIREQQLRHYAETVAGERNEVIRCTQQLADEIHAARSMNPLEDYLKLTEFELSKLATQLMKTPTLSSERPKLEKFVTQMTEQRDFLKSVITSSQKNLDQQAKKLKRIIDASRLSVLPPLPPRQR